MLQRIKKIYKKLWLKWRVFGAKWNDPTIRIDDDGNVWFIHIISSDQE